MTSTIRGVSSVVPVDPDVTTPISPIFVDHEPLIDQRPTVPCAMAADEAPPARRDTPLLPATLPLSTESRATLTVLTGIHAGRIVAVDGAPITIGRAPEADLAVDDNGVSRRHVRIARTPEGAFYAEDLASTNGTYRGTEAIGVALLQGGDVLQLGPQLQVRFAVVDAVAESLYRRLYESSVRDPLTHLFNRRHLDEHLGVEIARARRCGSEVAILMIDVDRLKDVNDLFGHLSGDRALCTIAARILHALRAGDLLARYGGDEFVVVATGTPLQAARQLAERVRRGVQGLHMSARGRDVHVTASIGVAALRELEPSDDPVAALFALADGRTYEAKAAGRNRVHAASLGPGQSAK